MSKYDNLFFYLTSLDAPRWTAGFTEIELILGFPLPRSAHTYTAWWSNQAGDGHSQSSAWQSAGWRTCEVDLDGRTVTFINHRHKKTVERVNHIAAHDQTTQQALNDRDVTNASGEKLKIAGLTIAEAKAGLALHFGVPPESIQITIKG